METESKSSILAIGCYELIGTSIIMYGQMMSGSSPIDLTHTTSLLALVLAWNISGGHFNPAISIGMFIA